MELPLLASVIAYLETLAAHEEEIQPEADGDSQPVVPALPPPSDQQAPVLAESASPVAATDAARPRIGTFWETPWGGLVTPEGGSAIRIPYSVVAAAGMRHGDQVSMTPLDDGSDHYFYTRTGSKANVAPSTVREIVGVLRQGGNGWQADIDGHPVVVRAAVPYLPELADGHIVSLRYDPEELQRPTGCGWVVRVHDNASRTDSPAIAVRRRVSGQRRTVAAATPAAPSDDAPDEPIATPVTLTPQLPRLLVIGGHAQNHLHYRQALQVVAAVDWCPGTRLTRSLRGRLEAAPAVVLVTQHMSHNVSTYVMRVLRSTNRPYIFARSGNHTGLARQVIEELLPQLNPDVEEQPG